VASPWSPSRLLGWARARRKTSFFAAQGFEPLAATISTTITHLQRLWMEVIYSCLSAQSVSTDSFNLSPPLGVSQAVRREALMVLAHNKIAPPKVIISIICTMLLRCRLLDARARKGLDDPFIPTF
jgi:hypothetical protein